MAVPFALLVAVALQVDRNQTLGYTYAQILGMGMQRWTDRYRARKGSSTIETNAGFSIYGAALAWRNDRLLKGRASELRDRLQAFADHAQAIGSAESGGGDRWTVAAGVGYMGAEETLYHTLCHSYRGPSRTVSEVERAVGSLTRLGVAAKDPEARATARDEGMRLREETRALLRLAKRMPRRDSDAVLEFARRSASEAETLASGPRR